MVIPLSIIPNVTPKCLWEVVMGTDFPLKKKSRFSGTLRLQKIMISVLELLSARRKRRKLQLFYNIVNKNTPNYLCTLIPPPYNVRQCIRWEMGMILFYLFLACMYIGQSKKKCFKFSRAAPHQQDGSDTIPTRNKSKFKSEAEKCTSYESILISFFFLFVNIYHWLVISATYSNACLLCTSLL
jgi:hypothetical protein